MGARTRTEAARPSARSAPAPEAPERREYGPWRVDDTLGAGGMGVVYRATHAADGRRAAVKTVRVADPLLLQGLRREIRALARLTHPGIVRILDVGLGDAVPWYAMELLEGASYRRRLRRTGDFDPNAPTVSGPVSAARVSGPVTRPSAAGAPDLPPPSPEQRVALLRVLPPLCDALAFLHGEGIVHLDLKPDNVFVDHGGRVVLMDFGLAARATAGHGREALDVTAKGLGTLAYISPEQIRGDPLDARADLYALGCMLYEALTGRTPFVGEIPASVAFGHLELEPQPPSELAEGIPAELERLALGLLEKAPHRRLGYAADVGREIDAALGAARPSPSPAPRAYLYRPELVGRDEALSTLAGELARAGGGAASVVLVGGESGVGKTRLALELARRSAAGQFDVHTGECAALAPGEVAGALLSPFAELFHAAADRSVERGAAESARLFGPNVKVLVPHAPALATLPGVAAAPEPERLPARATRARLVRTVVHVLTELARDVPLLCLVDDIHWADDATLGVLDALAREPWAGAHGILVVATYRSDELTPEIRALAALETAETGARGRVRSVRVGRLDGAGARAMVDGMLGAAPLPDALVRRVTEQAEGNPFFIAEYLRAAVREGVLVRTSGRWSADDPDGRRIAALPAPRAIVELVERRFERLSPIGREVAEAAAVLGREFDPGPIAEVLARPEGDVLDGLQELLATQMAEPVEGGRVRFVHARLHEATYGRLGPERRRELHGAAGRALAEGLPRAGLSAVLAKHFRESETPHDALPHLEAAAFEALAAGDHRGARVLFEEHEALARTAPTPLDPERRARAARGLGDACFSLGDLASAAEEGRRALDVLGHRLPESVGGALGALAREGTARLFSARPDEPTARRLEEAALAAQRVAEAAYYALDPTQLVAGAVLATTFAARAGGGAKVAKASAMLGVVLASLGMKKQAAAYGDEAIERARAAGDHAGHCFALYARSAGLCTTGDLGLARDVGLRALEVAEALGDPHELGMSEACVGNAEYFLGELASAAARYARIEAVARRADLSQLATWGLYAQARSLVHTGELEHALALSERARAALAGVADEASEQIVLGLAASAQAGLGRDDAARASLATLAARARKAPGTIFAVAPGYAGACTAALELHRRGDASALGAAKEAAKWLAGVARGNAVVESTAAVYEGRVALAEGRTGAGRRALRRAIALASSRGMRLDEGAARMWLGSALGGGEGTAERDRGVEILKSVGARRELRAFEEAG